MHIFIWDDLFALLVIAAALLYAVSNKTSISIRRRCSLSCEKEFFINQFYIRNVRCSKSAKNFKRNSFWHEPNSRYDDCHSFCSSNSKPTNMHYTEMLSFYAYYIGILIFHGMVYLDRSFISFHSSAYMSKVVQ